MAIRRSPRPWRSAASTSALLGVFVSSLFFNGCALIRRLLGNPIGKGGDGLTYIVSCRMELFPNQEEGRGYKLYSYFLLSGPPASQSDSLRYIRFFESYCQGIRKKDSLLVTGRRDSLLNVVFWPLLARVDTSDSLAPVRLYDYGRSERILTNAGLIGKKGPFIVTNQIPLSDLGMKPPENQSLVFDLSGVNDLVFDDLVLKFKRKVMGDPRNFGTFQVGGIRDIFRSWISDLGLQVLLLYSRFDPARSR